MNDVVITTILVPGFVSLLLFLVFTYLYEQSRQQYFRAWQLAWAAYSLHYILDAFPDSSVAFFVSELFMGAVGVVLALLTLHGHIVNGLFRPDVQPSTGLGLGLAAILLYCSAVFLLNG